MGKRLCPDLFSAEEDLDDVILEQVMRESWGREKPHSIPPPHTHARTHTHIHTHSDAPSGAEAVEGRAGA